MANQVSVRRKTFDQISELAKKLGVTNGTVVELALASHLGTTPTPRPRVERKRKLHP